MQVLMQTYGPGGGAGGAELIASAAALVFIVAIIGAVVCLWGVIFSKAGYSFWLGLLMLIPLANLIWLLIFACSKWPVQQEVERLRAQAGGYGTGGFPVTPHAGYQPPYVQG